MTILAKTCKNYFCQSGFYHGKKPANHGRSLIAPRRLLLVLVVVSTPLRIVNCCCSNFPVSGGINMLGTLTLTGGDKNTCGRKLTWY